MPAKRTLIVVGPVLALGLLFAIQRPQVAIATVDEERSMAQALAAAGTTFQPLGAGQKMSSVAANAIGVERAADAAVSMYGKVDVPVVYQGFLTLADVEPTVQDQPVYAVQLRGLEVPGFGGNRGQGRVHTELVVFVDAASGGVIVATSVR